MERGDAALEAPSAEVSDGAGRPVDEALERLLEAETSLTGSEAKVLVALLGLRTGSLKQLSELTGIRQSNIYGVTDSLALKGLCRRLGGRASVWVCPEPADVLERLRAAEVARLDEARNGLERAFGKAQQMLVASSDVEERPIMRRRPEQVPVPTVYHFHAALDTTFTRRRGHFLRVAQVRWLCSSVRVSSRKRTVYGAPCVRFGHVASCKLDQTSG